MSFILDALKKSETERQEQSAAEFSSVPSSSGGANPLRKILAQTIDFDRLAQACDGFEPGSTNPIRVTRWNCGRKNFRPCFPEPAFPGIVPSIRAYFRCRWPRSY